MRREAIAAIAFAGGLSLAIIAMTPADGMDEISTESFDRPALPVAEPLTPRQAQAGIERPEWQLGEAWRIQFEGADPICWLAVATADDDGYQQGFWCPNDEGTYIAAQVAAFPQAYLGRLGPGLSGFDRDSSEVLWFDWPLRDGKSWPAHVDGADVVATATYAMVQGARGEEPGYTIVMTLDGEPYISYDYAPSLRWWSRITFEQFDYTFRVHEHTAEWSEAVQYGEAHRIYLASQGLNVIPQPGGPTFQMSEDDDVGFLYIQREGLRVHRLQIRDPSGNQVYESNDANVGAGTQQFALLPGAPGTWTVVNVAPAAGAIHLVIWGVDLIQAG